MLVYRDFIRYFIFQKQNKFTDLNIEVINQKEKWIFFIKKARLYCHDVSTRGQCCLNCFCVIDPADLLQCRFVSACRHDELLRGDFLHHKLLICTHASKETFYLSSDDTRREFCPKACSGPDPWAGPHRGSELFWWLEQMSSSRRSPETSLDFIQTSLWSFSQSLVN